MRAHFLTALLTPTLLLLGLALLATSDAHAMGTPDGETPTNEGICDELLGFAGLYGLCVGFCEAQDCEATLDATTGEVTFGDNCKKRSPRLLEVYNELAQPGDPAMPCVEVVSAGCPCEGLVNDIGLAWDSTFETSLCDPTDPFRLRGGSGELQVQWRTGQESCTIFPRGNPDEIIRLPLSTQAEVDACIASLVAIAAEDGVICPGF